MSLKLINVEPLLLRNLNSKERLQVSKKDKKYAVDLPMGKTIYFGHRDYDDYTLHRDPERLKKYLSRHTKRENWKLSGIDTPGFWSRWLLWNKPSFNKSLQDIEDRFSINIINKTKRID